MIRVIPDLLKEHRFVPVPCSRFKSVRSFITLAELFESRSPLKSSQEKNRCFANVGSSNKSNCGEFAIALAIVTLCCSPPDSCAGI